MTTRLSTVAAILIAITIHEAVRAQDISVRAISGATPEAERKLAEIAEPLQVSIAANVDPIAVVRSICGRLTPTYSAILSSSNPKTALQAAPHRRTLSVPACFVVKPMAKLKPVAGEVLGAFAERTVGVAGPATLKILIETNSTLRQIADRMAIKGAMREMTLSADMLTVPHATEPAVYRLRPEAALDTATAIKALNALGGPGVEAADLPDRLRLESDINPAASVAASCPANASAVIADDRWPFDAKTVIAALRRNDQIRLSNNMPPAGEATVAVADNGVDGIGTFFPLSLLAVNRGEVPGDKSDNDGNSYKDDLFGVNVISGDVPKPLSGKDPWHGTHLSGLAIGSSDFLSALSAAGGTAQVKLLAISLVETKVIPNLDLGNRTEFVMPTKAVEGAFRYAQQQSASVVNFSVSTPEQLQILQADLTRANTILLVAAAGNQATDFASSSRFPAAYGGKPDQFLPLPVVSVAAHDRKKCLAGFSGRGRDKIDLAAPGVDISSISLGGNPRVVSGTSQATAIVSFAAALLNSEGIKDAMAVKRRLLASVDPSPGLRDHVFSGGALNIVKSLSIFEDVIEVAGQGLSYGAIAPRPTLQSVCAGNNSSNPVQILKIFRDERQAGNIQVMVRWNENNNIQYLSCTPASSHFTFRENGTDRSISFSDVVDLVPRN